MNVILIAIALLAIYLTITISTFGVPKSFSDTFYLLENKEQGLGYLFSIVCFSVGILAIIAMYEAAPMLAGIAFGAGASLGFVGAAPIFRAQDSKVHIAAALTCALFAILYIVLSGFALLLIATIVSAYYIGRNNDNIIFWLEMSLFATLFISVLW